MDWKKLLHKLLFPGAAVVLLSIPVGFGLLAYAFLVAGEESPIATVSYVLSAYSLVVVCANAVPLFRKGSQWVRGLPLVSQLLEDVLTACGFQPYTGEWWHFSDLDNYPVEESWSPPK